MHNKYKLILNRCINFLSNDFYYQALSDCVRCVPGQRDVDEAIAHMETQLSQLIDQIHMGTDRPQRPFAELQTEIAERAERVNSVATDVTTSVQAPVKLASWARRLDGAVTGLVTTGVDVARQTKVEYSSVLK